MDSLSLIRPSLYRSCVICLGTPTQLCTHVTIVCVAPCDVGHRSNKHARRSRERRVRECIIIENTNARDTRFARCRAVARCLCQVSLVCSTRVCKLWIKSDINTSIIWRSGVNPVSKNLAEFHGLVRRHVSVKLLRALSFYRKYFKIFGIIQNISQKNFRWIFPEGYFPTQRQNAKSYRVYIESCPSIIFSFC